MLAGTVARPDFQCPLKSVYCAVYFHHHIHSVVQGDMVTKRCLTTLLNNLNEP